MSGAIDPADHQYQLGQDEDSRAITNNLNNISNNTNNMLNTPRVTTHTTKTTTQAKTKLTVVRETITYSNEMKEILVNGQLRIVWALVDRETITKVYA